ncbi:MAG: serine/threonine-protein kinase [Candidatus Sericytochromatia bacterium]
MSLDNYEIVKELGRGGMGAVFLANDKRLKRQVAIKVLKLPPTLDFITKTDNINNFKREAVAIANLAHNNIVCVYDIGNKEDVHYIVMELIEGSPLSKILKMQGQPFHIDTVMKIADEMCDALAYIHKNKVIHRDIKPENIIYTAKGISKLTDFGISKFVGDENMKVGAPGDVKGTILYISPEQLQAPDAVDGRADMYSFGVSLYELLTGKLPFEGESPREVIMKILTQAPIAPSKVIPDLLPHIDHIILKTLEKDPDKRYKDIDAFKDDLNNLKDFMSRSSFQGGIKGMKKGDEKVYNDIFIDSFDDIIKYANRLPETGQQRLMYEMEMLISKYFEEYSDQIDGANKGLTSEKSFENDDDDDNDNFDNYSKPSTPAPPTQKQPPFYDSMKYVLPQITPEGQQIINQAKTGNTLSLDLTIFLSKIDGMRPLNIITSDLQGDKLYNFLNNLMAAQQKNIVILNIAQKYKEPILIGDLLLAFGFANKYQIDSCLSRKSNTPNSKMLGEMLVDSGVLTRDKLLNTLKIQHWYKKLFN